MERRFEEELESLKGRILNMGAQVERNIADAIRGLIERNSILAQEVAKRDPEIDLAEVKIDHFCINLLALRQPVARDLRFITTALKIVKDLERVGDIARDIATRSLHIMAAPPVKPYIELPIMAQCAQGMLKSALDAFVRQDVELARRIIEKDDVVDDLHDKIFNELVKVMIADSGKVERCTHLVSVCKYIERIGDHSSNLAEMVVFLVEGEDIRHLAKIQGLLEKK